MLKAQAPYTSNMVDVAAGSYSLTAKATDNLGASTSSTAVPVSVTAHIPKAYDIQSDHLNTLRMITDSTGTIVWQWDSDPFGATLPNENPGNTGSTNDFVFNPRFPGQYFDKETGLHYNYFRDYEPQTGRYVESDPIGLRGGTNTFAYVKGFPSTKTDPFGLSPYPIPMPPYLIPMGPGAGILWSMLNDGARIGFMEMWAAAEAAEAARAAAAVAAAGIITTGIVLALVPSDLNANEDANLKKHWDEYEKRKKEKDTESMCRAPNR